MGWRSDRWIARCLRGGDRTGGPSSAPPGDHSPKTRIRFALLVLTSRAMPEASTGTSANATSV
eukprot:3544347-Pyramimonas_sp.AAC.1